MKGNGTRKSFKWITASWSCFEGELESDSSTKATYGGSPDSNSGKKNPRSISSRFVHRLKIGGSRPQRRKFTQTDEMEVENNSPSEGDSSFVAGRLGSICDGPPVSCPPTPPIYTPTCELPLTDSASSSFRTKTHDSHRSNNPKTKKREKKYSQENIVAIEQANFAELDIPYHKHDRLSTAIPTLEDDRDALISPTGQKMDQERWDHEKNKSEASCQNRRLPSPSPKETLTILLTRDKNCCVFNLHRSRNQISSPHSHSQALNTDKFPYFPNGTPTSFKSVESCSAVSSILKNETPLAQSVIPGTGVECPTCKNTPHSPKNAMNLWNASAATQVVVPLEDRDQIFFRADDDDDNDEDEDEDVEGDVETLRSNEGQESTTLSMIDASVLEITNLRPKLKLDLSRIGRKRPKSRCVLYCKEIQFSLDEGILNTDSELFFETDKTPTSFCRVAIATTAVQGEEEDRKTSCLVRDGQPRRSILGAFFSEKGSYAAHQQGHIVMHEQEHHHHHSLRGESGAARLEKGELAQTLCPCFYSLRTQSFNDV